MSCRLFGAKPKINIGLLSIVPLETQFSDVLIEIQNFHLQKCIWKYRLPNGGNFVQGGGGGGGGGGLYKIHSP